MLINEDIKIDYSDVLIRPKRSTMNSRGEVYLGRTHKFLWSKKKWTGIPIMSANMDTVGTPGMHKVLSKNNMITCPAKHYLKKDVSKFKGGLENICWFGGIDDIKHLSKIKKGFIETTEGLVIGEHDGIANYTIGQRKGIGIGNIKGFTESNPLYVIDIDKNEFR